MTIRHRAEHRLRRRAQAAAAALAVALLGAACDLAPGETPSPSPTDLTGPAPVVLPGEDVLLPPGVDGGGAWAAIDRFPGQFDPDQAHETPQAVADAFAQAIVMSFGGGVVRPRVELAMTEELDDDRVLLILNQTGIADDSVAGAQSALVVAETGGGWVVDDVYVRLLCTRAVSDGSCA